MGFLDGSVVKNLSASAGDGFNSWVRKLPGGGNGNPLQYFCLGNPTHRGAWWATVHRVANLATANMYTRSNAIGYASNL